MLLRVALVAESTNSGSGFKKTYVYICKHYKTVGGLVSMNFMTFHSVGNGIGIIIIPTDELHHFSEG